MQKLNSKEELQNLLTASTASIALGAAIETGLIQLLAEKPMSGDEVSQAMNIPGKRGHYWLQLLTELGMLELDSQGYVPSNLAREVFLDANDFSKLRLKHRAIDEREHLAGISNLALYISEPSIWKVQGLPEPKGYVEKMNDDPQRAYAFTHLLYNLHQGLGSALAELLDLTGVERMMDIGGGSGVTSMALARKYPNLTSVIVDIENVCVAGREIVEENHLSNRITYHVADFVADELPQGFDFILHCDIGVFGEELFRKLWASLKPGGLIVVLFHFPPSEDAAPAPFLEWAFLDSLNDPQFGFPTAAQTREQMIRAGFQVLPGEHVLPDGRIVIQARKENEMG